MPLVEADGIRTRYESVGEGPPLLMFSPGGFDSHLESWRTVGVYRRLGLIDALAERYRLILFDRRESGSSGGRVERLSWARYVKQAVGLLDALGIEQAHLMGGCVGCSSAALVAMEVPHRVRSMVLYSPAGGYSYRAKQHERFTRHLGFVAENGLRAVVDLARSTTAGFSEDPRVGPWAAPLRGDDAFAKAYAATDVGRYRTIVSGSARLLFDRDTVPGLEPEDLRLLDIPALIVPGQDSSHTPSAARYLQECLPRNEFWDVPVDEQTSANAPRRILDFLAGH